MIKFEEGVTYTLTSNKGAVFTGVFIDNRKYEFSPGLKGKDGDGRCCHLPLNAINNPEHGWTVGEVRRDY